MSQETPHSLPNEVDPVQEIYNTATRDTGLNEYDKKANKQNLRAAGALIAGSIITYLAYCEKPEDGVAMGGLTLVASGILFNHAKNLRSMARSKYKQEGFNNGVEGIFGVESQSPDDSNHYNSL